MRKRNVKEPHKTALRTNGPAGKDPAGRIAALGLSAEDRRVVERICATWSNLDDIFDAVAGPREPIGELLLAAGRITLSKLAAALAEQRETGEKLGELMVRKGWVTAPEIATLLRLQARLGQARGHTPGPVQLGNLLVSAGEITADQLQDAVVRHRQSRRRIGEVLIDAGYATEKQIERGLLLQRAIATFALVAALALSLQPGDGNAASMMGVDGGGKTRASASLDFAVKISAYLRIKFLSQPQMLTIEAADVERGYVDVPADTHLQVLTNNRDGFLVNFQARFDVIRKVLVKGMANSVEIDAEAAGATVRHPFRAPETKLALGYRFFLASGVRPGSYPWPMAISAGAQY